MYVVKEGKIVGTFEVGKDIDGITFKNPLTPSLEDFVKYGDTKVGLKSATAMSMYGMTYVYISMLKTISHMQAYRHTTLLLKASMQET